MQKELDRLINKVNKVTSNHRHGNLVSDKMLNDLANAQLDYETEFQSAQRHCSTGEWSEGQGGQQDGGVYEAIEPLINDIMKYNRTPRDRACKLLTALNISPDAVRILLKNKWVG